MPKIYSLWDPAQAEIIPEKTGQFCFNLKTNNTNTLKKLKQAVTLQSVGGVRIPLSVAIELAGG